MRRRTYLSATTACLASLAGCSRFGDGIGDGTETTAGPTDSPTDETSTASGTPTATPMPADKYAARLTVKAESAGLEGEFGVQTGDDGTPFFRYEAVKETRFDQRDRARSAYDALVEEGHIGRDLDARVTDRDTGQQWYRWNAKEAWARAYVEGDLSKGEYLQNIDKTVREW